MEINVYSKLSFMQKGKNLIQFVWKVNIWKDMPKNWIILFAFRKGNGFLWGQEERE